jgi:hypothetical protein
VPKEVTRRKRPWLLPTLAVLLALALVATGIWAYQVWVELTSLPTVG